jgi:lysophospholipase L1-like esterase
MMFSKVNTIAVKRLMLAVVLCVSAFGQAPPGSRAAQRLEEYRQSKAATLRDDFGELARYRAANASLKPAAPDEKRVVFFGDSITDMWNLAEYFPGKPYINRGIGGQTTPQMLLRFRQDVIALEPKVVVILAGTNDIAGNTGPMSLEDIEANYASLAELAKADSVHVVFASILPVHNYTSESQDLFAQRSPQKIVELNRWLKSYSTEHGDIYLDYFSPMVDEKGLLKRDLAEDGLHPNKAGYSMMARLVVAAIEKAYPNKP